MEVYFKVLDKLEVPDRNDFQFLHFKYIIANSDKLLKLSFSSSSGVQEFILVKTAHNAGPYFTQSYNGFKNMISPSFFIEHNSAIYAIFEAEFIKNYNFQDYFDPEHTVLMLKVFSNMHGNFLLESPSENKNNNYNSFFQCIQNHMQKIEEHLNEGPTTLTSQFCKPYFGKILATLETTLDKNYWVPSMGHVNKNPVFFKYDDHGKPIDFKILLVTSLEAVPPLFDILVFIFSCPTEDTRREYLHEFLHIYCKQLEKELGSGVFDSEQFNFQIISFIPLIKLLKFIASMELKPTDNGYTSNLEELAELQHCPRLLREECYEILANYLGHTKYLLQTFSLTPLQHRYGNLGDYFKLKAKINLEHEEKEVNVFVKFLPSNNESTNAVAKNGPSKKEDFFYNFFIKEFVGCGLQEFLNFAPKCFLSKINYVLILEDLGLQGYRLVTEQNYFTYDMLKLTVKKMAQLHACSLIFEETKSTELQRKFRLDEYYGDYLGEIIFQREKEDIMVTFADVGEFTITNYLIYLYPEVLRKLSMEEFHKRSKITFKNFYPKVLKSNKYRNTLCHGDTWDTNIMFKFDSNNCPIDCKLVDFQMTRYCPPIQDVMSHLYLTTTRDTRTKYLSTLLEEYYTELSKIVSSFGFDMEKVLPAEEFKNSCLYMKSQAICQSLLYAPINLSTYEERASVFGDSEKFEQTLLIDRRPFIEEMMKRHSFYKDRLGEYIQDLYDICENEQY